MPRTKAAPAAVNEPIWVLIQSWAGLTRHKAVKLGDCVRRGKPHVKARMLETAFRHHEGKIVYPPVSAVRPRQED